jgi:phosphoglycolate phosphatase-like HAD superfamily hydrolase
MNEDTLWTLELLRSWGIRLVVSSNGAQHFVDDFQKTSPFSFDLVLGHGPGMAKGQPHVDRVMELFSITPDQMLFVGDSLKDGELARGCGQRFIGRTGTFRREEFEARLCGVPAIDQLSDLRFMVAPCK